MPLNKQAVIRYQVLDRCFANRFKRYYIEDLLEACNKALYEYGGKEQSVNKRQLYNDISFMESEQGWSIPLKRIQDGKRVYYRYEDSQFSINRRELDDEELNRFQALLIAVSRIKGLPDFGKERELIDVLKSKYHIDGNIDGVIGLDQNSYLSGIEHFELLFHSIINKQCLLLSYHTFNGDGYEWTIHPYYLKQFNNRWFLLGCNDASGKISTIPLDRIEKVELSGRTFKETEIDFDEYFDDIVGVTVREDSSLENVVLRFAPVRFPYVLSKPIHPSQKVLDKESCVVSIDVIPNNELISLILSFGKDIEVCSPLSLREAVAGHLRDALKNY